MSIFVVLKIVLAILAVVSLASVFAVQDRAGRLLYFSLAIFCIAVLAIWFYISSLHLLLGSPPAH